MDPIFRRSYPDAERSAVQDAVISRVEQQTTSLLASYVADERSFDGRYVCADLAKDLFPEYSSSREARGKFNNAVHNAAAVLAAEQFRVALQREPLDGRRKVVFLTGVPGAGKTTTIMARGKLPADVHCIFEGQLVRPETTFPKIQAAIDAGLEPVVIAVHTTPENALDNTIKRHTEYGRGASMSVMAQIMGGLPDGLRAVQERFGDAVTLQVVDYRDRSNPRSLTGWPAVSILESEGHHEQIVQRLASRLAFWQSSGALSPECFAQAAGTAPARAVPVASSTAPGRVGAVGDGGHEANDDGRDVPPDGGTEAVLRPRQK